MVKALLFLADNWNLPGTIKTCSFNGIAAVNVLGQTLSSMFSWSRKGFTPGTLTSKSHRDRFAPVILLVVDEISTLGQHFLGGLDLSLREIKDNPDRLAGGIHLLMIGDFLQMPPIAALSVFEHVHKVTVDKLEEEAKQNETPDLPRRKNRKQKIIATLEPKVPSMFDLCVKGKNLYDRVNTVVYLAENMRHRSNPKWASILDRWRKGIFIQEDLDYVNGICYRPPGASSDGQETPMPGSLLSANDIQNPGLCPIISSANVLVQQYNSVSTLKYAQKTDQKIFRVLAESKGTKRIRRRDLIYLRGSPPSFTGRIALCLDICVGMPVSCTTNNSQTPDLHMANGSLGQVIYIKWADDTIFHNHGAYCLPNQPPEIIFIKLYNDSSILVPGLPPGVLPIVRPTESKSIDTVLRGRSFKTSWIQFPIVPAWSITVDKSQGLTLPAAILAPLKTPERRSVPGGAFYVQSSRCRTVERIRLLEPLTLGVLQWRKGCKAEKNLAEDNRLKALSL